MNNITLEDLKNESDVEQKFIYELLTQESPFGLGYLASDFRTKVDIRKLTIDKGTKRDIYYPDYIVVVEGLPLIVIEAKEPNSKLDDALKEARLYATEINSNYQAGFNPCSKIIVSNGKETLFTEWDNANSIRSVEFQDINVSSESFHLLLEFAGKQTIINALKNLKLSIRGETSFLKPTQLLGGKAFQNATLGENSFGSNISFEYRHLFNPNDANERAQIALNAYVASKRRLSHVDPIDRLIRATLTPSFSDSRLISNTEHPSEVISVLNKPSNIKKQIILLIGSVGSGKSTFLDYLKEVALPDELRKRTFWLSVNMNDSPKSIDLVYKWVLEQAITRLRVEFTSSDFESLEFLTKIFSYKISQFDKGPIALFEKESDHYKSELYKLLVELKADHQQYFKYLLEYLVVSRGQSVLFVMDNVDKRDRDSQLLMFEVANWLKSTFNLTVFLPLREVTYDSYRNEPPLDTVIKDFVFRIDPPLLEQVIYKRFQYLTREVSGSNVTFKYVLRDGMTVECKRSEILNYLSCILKALFQNKFFKRLIIGLSDRDIRRGLEIFLDFCKSGYFQEKDIFKMRLATDDFELPNHLITRIILRRNRRYFLDGSSPILNLFHSDANDEIPDPFARVSILRWLDQRKTLAGASNTKGYHKIANLKRDLACLGHAEKRLDIELETLFKAQCIITETQSLDLNPENLICITAAGVVHLELLGNADYLSTVSEDTCFKTLQVAEAIKDNIAGKDVAVHLNKANTIENSKLLLSYLKDYESYFPIKPSAYLRDGAWQDLHKLVKSFQVIENLENKHELDNCSSISNHPSGEIVEAEIVSIKDYGLFVEFGLGAQGFIHISSFIKENNPTFLDEKFDIGESVVAEVVGWDEKHGRFKLRVY